ncbi:MAG: hypothetical protein K5656_02430, partial [Lachnospiraceae bacterium]|nr:hypothetical protein [Lachnospiraceae bacterium]
MKSFIKAFVATFIICATIVGIYIFLAANNVGVPGGPKIVAFLEDKGLLYKEDYSSSVANNDVTTEKAADVEETTEEPTTEDPLAFYDNIEFNPKATANTEPSKLLSKTEIFVDNQATSAENFKPWYNMNFGGPE